MLVVYERSERIPEPPRGSETCTAHKIQKSPYATIREKRWGNVRQERKAGGRYQHTANCDGDIQPHRRRRQVMPEI